MKSLSVAHGMGNQYLVFKLLNRTAKIWDVETGSIKENLEGHTYAVSVLTLPNGITITGS